jgi:copper oxidase (laccase) domain-containing protein
VGDDPDAVADNRRRLADTLGDVPLDPAAWVWLRQVHGHVVVRADADPAAADPAAADPTAADPTPGATVPPAADAAVTGTAGLPLVVMAADCAPIALVAPEAVGVVHAGWPGLEQGVIGAAVDALRELSPGPVRAWLGPCVHPADYEFGPDLLARLVDMLGPDVAATTRTGTPALDIPTAVRVSLGRAGVHEVVDVGISTAASSDHFSHRRDGVTGRQAVVVVRTP